MRIRALVFEVEILRNLKKNYTASHFGNVHLKLIRMILLSGTQGSIQIVH